MLTRHPQALALPRLNPRQAARERGSRDDIVIV
jgi:hypothetical protein